MRSLLALGLTLSGCTTIKAAAPGAQPGEVYVTAERSNFIFPPTSYVARCIPDPSTQQPRCSVMFVGDDFGAMMNPQVQEFSAWVAACRARGFTESRAGTPKAAHVDIGTGISPALQEACERGYSLEYDRSGR